MTKPAKILGLSSVLILAVAFWIGYTRRGKASYQGRSVHYWFRQYLRAKHSSDDVEGREARTRLADQSRQALRSLGTNALPYLLDQAFRTSGNSPLAQKLDAWFYKLPDSWRWPRSIGQDVISADALDLICNSRAPMSQVLGPVRSHLSGTNTELHLRALRILECCVGPEEDKIGLVTGDLTNADQMISMEAFQRFFLHGRGGSDPKIVKIAMPGLLTSVQTPSRRWFGLWAVRSLEGEAAEAVPVLEQAFFSTTNSNERLDMAETMFAVDASRVKTLMPSLLHEFESAAKWDDRLRSARMILRIDPDVPTVLRFLQDEWRSETNLPQRGKVWEVFVGVLHTNLPSPRIPPDVLWYVSPAFERWLAIGKGIRSTIQGPTLEQWLARASGAEPQFEGLSLKQWLNQWLNGRRLDTFSENPVFVSTQVSTESKRAIRSMGTNAIPWLLTWIESSSAEEHILARRGFNILGEDSRAATPALVELTTAPDQALRARAYGCLKALQLDWTDTWAALVPVLHNQDKSVRSEAADYLYRAFPDETERAGLKGFVSPLLTR